MTTIRKTVKVVVTEFQTTTSTADQVVATIALPANCVVVIEVELFVKKNADAEAGSIWLKGTFYRNGSGNVVRVSDDEGLTKMSAGLSCTADLNPSTTNLQVRVSPGAALTLDWGMTHKYVFRTS